MDLRPYQVEARDAIFKEWEDKDKTLLVLPTGCGKTIVFASVANERTKEGKVLILAHREELLTQAADKIHQAFGLDSCVEKAGQTCLGRDEPIVVGSIQSMQRERRLERFPDDYFKTIIVDEAHHALADTYKRVLDHFDGCKVLGVTATPDRGDMKNLGQYFQSLAYEYSIRDAVKQGYLSPIKVLTCPLNIDLSSVKISQGDYSAGDVGNALEPYLEDIADEMVKTCKGRHTVVFLPLISTSQKFRMILASRGFRAAEVNGESINREEVLQEFADGKYDVLCNSMLLTEGWDCPIVDCIIVLRPTKIRSLYCQMIGRGTRLHEGKDHLLVLDFLWMTGKHQLVHPADIICKTEKTAKKVTERLAKSNEEEDLFAAENSVEEQRHEALAKALKESKANRKERKFVDPLAFDIAAPSISDYEPTFGWEYEGATEKQLQLLHSFGLDVGVDYTKGRAKAMINALMEREHKGLATPRQIALLTKRGFQRIDEWSKTEASAIIGMYAAVNWKPWLVNIDPKSYLPKRLEEAWT